MIMETDDHYFLTETAREVWLRGGKEEEDKLLETGLSLAEEMLLTSPNGLRMSKHALGLNIDAPSLEAAMAIEDRQQTLLGGSPDAAEAMTAFIEKRAPVYRGV